MAAADVHKLILDSLSQTMGEPAHGQQWQRITGGSIHQSWALTLTSGQQFFVKTNTANHLPLFAAEWLGLQTLRYALNTEHLIHIPQPLHMDSQHHHAWLMIEYLHLHPSPSHSHHAHQHQLGVAMARLHQQHSHTFGFTSDNFIGWHSQHNQPHTVWMDFYIQQRLMPQFALANVRGFAAMLPIASLLDAATLLLQDHHPAPSLLHGDLWSGNQGATTEGWPAIFDPAVYFGDRECDIAMSELFGGFSPAFYAAYDAEYPIDKAYNQRRDLYHLYPMLNHANMFAGHYIPQCAQLMKTIIRSI